MIFQEHIDEWTKVVPWQEARQIQQDLIITIALLKLYNDPNIRNTLAFRGGTALNKIFFEKPYRYSEDIDLVQIESGPIGPIFKLIKDALESFLGKPRSTLSYGRLTLIYRITDQENLPLKLKIEINTREHFTVLGFEDKRFFNTSSLEPGETLIRTYKIEELLGTKMRALYQRRKGRDLFDLYICLKTLSINPDDIIRCFVHYLDYEKKCISRSEFITNLETKLVDQRFLADIIPLLPRDFRFDLEEAHNHVVTHLINRL